MGKVKKVKLNLYRAETCFDFGEPCHAIRLVTWGRSELFSVQMNTNDENL